MPSPPGRGCRSRAGPMASDGGSPTNRQMAARGRRPLQLRAAGAPGREWSRTEGRCTRGRRRSRPRTRTRSPRPDSPRRRRTAQPAPDKEPDRASPVRNARATRQAARGCRTTARRRSGSGSGNRALRPKDAQPTKARRTRACSAGGPTTSDARAAPPFVSLETRESRVARRGRAHAMAHIRAYT